MTDKLDSENIGQSQEKNLKNDDPFADLSKLRIKQNFNETIGVKKAILHIPVRKPGRQEFVQVHPDENMRMYAAIIELKDEREVFLVLPDLAQDLSNEVTSKLLVTAINRQGVLFLWPINLDSSDERVRKNHWDESARNAAELATKGWVRVASNMSLGAYETSLATNNLAAPVWPDLTFQQILKIAFKDNLITTTDHIVIRKLSGET